MTRKGERCRKFASSNSDFCFIHGMICGKNSVKHSGLQYISKHPVVTIFGLLIGILGLTASIYYGMQSPTEAAVKKAVKESLEEYAYNSNVSPSKSYEYIKEKMGLNCSQVGDKLCTLIKDAEKALNSGMFDEAIRKYNALVELDTNASSFYFNRGTARYQLQQYKLAIRDFEEVIRIDPKDYAVYWSLGGISNKIGRFRQCIQYIEPVRDSIKKTFGCNNSYAQVLNTLAQGYRGIGNYKNAEKLILEAISIVQFHNKYPPYDLMMLQNNLANIYLYTANYQRALEILTIDTTLVGRFYGKTSHEFAVRLENLAEANRYLGHYRDAEPLYLRALEIGRNSIGIKHPNYSTRLRNLSILYTDMGRCNLADSLVDEALSIDSSFYGIEHMEYAFCLATKAYVQKCYRNYKLEEKYLLVAIKIANLNENKNINMIMQWQRNLCEVYRQNGKLKEALNTVKQALSIAGRNFGVDHLEYAYCLNQWGGLLIDMKKYKEANDKFTQAKNIIEKKYGSDFPFLHVVNGNIYYSDSLTTEQ